MLALSPLRHEDLGRGRCPTSAAEQKASSLYADALRRVAQKRGHGYVDLYDLLGMTAPYATSRPLRTPDNGMHLTGLWLTGAISGGAGRVGCLGLEAEAGAAGWLLLTASRSRPKELKAALSGGNPLAIRGDR